MAGFSGNGNGFRATVWRVTGGVVLASVLGLGAFTSTRAGDNDIEELERKKADRSEVAALQEDVREVRERTALNAATLHNIDKTVAAIARELEIRSRETR